MSGMDRDDEEYDIWKTGSLPSITENGTHYVVNMRLSVELLKQICTS